MSNDADYDEPVFDYEDPSITTGDNRVIWRGSPGQIVNFGTYIFCAAAIGLLWTLMPGRLAFYGSIAIALLAAVEFAKVYLTRYELTANTVTKRWGIMTTHIGPVPLYRVEDSGVVKPFFMRMFGRGVVNVISSDRSHPYMKLNAVTSPERLEEVLRQTYEQARARRGTRVIE